MLFKGLGQRGGELRDEPPGGLVPEPFEYAGASDQVSKYDGGHDVSAPAGSKVWRSHSQRFYDGNRNNEKPMRAAAVRLGAGAPGREERRAAALVLEHSIPTLPTAMTLSSFIKENMEAIVEEWLAFAKTMEPAATTMSVLALRDHAKPILLAIAKDLESSQTAAAQADKAKGWAETLSTRETAAATHGALRQVAGFDLNQLGAEYRALRASVIRLWMKARPDGIDADFVDDMIRFNEAVDQAVAESTSRYAAELALSRDTFMAILAHDLRSPLSAIRMIGHLMEKSGATEAARKQAVQIQRSAKEMGEMIRDLLEYTRTRLGKGIPIHPAPCSIGMICQEALAEVQTGQPSRQFDIDVADGLAAEVDSGRLRQALSNLLNNAVQHGDPASPIGLTATGTSSDIVIEVKNQGKPIPAESLQVIFDPLVQLSAQSVTGKEPSTNLGLGLFIAREVALGHHGTLEVASDPENGTVFTMRLPKQNGP
ncbi:sensor histidine kinase [Ramlibacter sp. WS9]|uniref:sensor histidine kinase n=1 Tax=Ramlibacter sp. WS9 TaxID=1882741 RepID=UPI0011442F4E|nr:sensor histidine kinase [Ramlibacter sp. WS9]